MRRQVCKSIMQRGGKNWTANSRTSCSSRTMAAPTTLCSQAAAAAAAAACPSTLTATTLIKTLWISSTKRLPCLLVAPALTVTAMAMATATMNAS